MANLIVVPESTDDRNVHLYGIAGFFKNNTPSPIREGDISNRQHAFGGYFRHDTDSKEIRGRLVDSMGPSIIIGEFTPETPLLIFSKHYDHAAINKELCYSFTLANGIWVGEWHDRANPDAHEKTQCIITPISERISSLVKEPQQYLDQMF